MKKILLAEDEKNFAEMLEADLEDAGYRVARVKGNTFSVNKKTRKDYKDLIRGEKV